MFVELLQKSQSKLYSTNISLFGIISCLEAVRTSQKEYVNFDELSGILNTLATFQAITKLSRMIKY